jgi:hypothetical protein
VLKSLEEKRCIVLGDPTTFSKIVIVILPLAIFDCARLVKSNSCQPFGGISVRVVRVNSAVEHDGALFQVALDSLNEEQACAETVDDVVPTTPSLQSLSTIDVGVIAAGHGISPNSNSRRI